MGTAEQYLAERLEFALAVFEHRTHVVCEEIGLDVRSRCDECPGCTAIALEFGLDSDHVSEEIRERAAPAVERKAADNVAVLRAHVGIVPDTSILVSLCANAGLPKSRTNPPL